MSDDDVVAEHFTSGTIWDRLCSELIDDGVDPEQPAGSVGRLDTSPTDSGAR